MIGYTVASASLLRVAYKRMLKQTRKFTSTRATITHVLVNGRRAMLDPASLFAFEHSLLC